MHYVNNASKQKLRYCKINLQSSYKSSPIFNFADNFGKWDRGREGARKEGNEERRKGGRKWRKEEGRKDRRTEGRKGGREIVRRKKWTNLTDWVWNLLKSLHQSYWSVYDNQHLTALSGRSENIQNIKTVKWAPARQLKDHRVCPWIKFL